jgi:tryptophan-rich sensory protein
MFSAWMIGFLLVMATLVWLAVIVGLPQPAIGLAIGALLAVAVIAAAALIRRQRPPRRRRG